MNKEEGDEVDVIVFSKDIYKTGDKIKVEILGMLTREDGDHKVIARDSSEPDTVFENLADVERKLILSYIGHKSPIVSIDSRDEAFEYINNSSI